MKLLALVRAIENEIEELRAGCGIFFDELIVDER
jgi:hypothetical protein